MKVKENLPYHELGITYRHRVRETFRDLLPDRDEVDILDLGCSRGLTTREIARLYPSSKVTGIDIYPDRIRDAKRNNTSKGRKLKFLVADGYFPPFPAESFDLVFAMNNLLYVILRDDYFCEFSLALKQNIRDIGKIVRNNGLLLVSGGRSFAGYVKNGRSFGMPVAEFGTDSSTPYSKIKYELSFKFILDSLNSR